MSYVSISPGLVAQAAGSVAGIGATVSVANATATQILPARQGGTGGAGNAGSAPAGSANRTGGGGYICTELGARR
jgi:hypothetical protein